MELMNHVAKHHCKDMQGEVEEEQVKEQEEAEKDGVFVFTKFMVDEFMK